MRDGPKFGMRLHGGLISARKLVPCRSFRPKFWAMLAPTSAKVARVPKFTPRRTEGPTARRGTYSRE
jgi:hypothetical protein